MDYLKNLLLLNLTCCQLGRSYSTHPLYLPTFDKLTSAERDEYYTLSAEIHAVWTFLNLPKTVHLRDKVQSLEDYHRLIKPINEPLLSICREYGITLTEEISETFKKKTQHIVDNQYVRRDTSKTVSLKKQSSFRL